MCYRNPRTDPVPAGRKRCSRCECDEPLENFHANASKLDGLDGWCKICVGRRSKRYDQMTRNQPSQPEPEPQQASPVVVEDDRPDLPTGKRECDCPVRPYVCWVPSEHFIA